MRRRRTTPGSFCWLEATSRARTATLSRRNGWLRSIEMTEPLIEFDPARYLNTPEAVEEYLVSSFEDVAELGDPRIITNALGVVARAKGMTQMARDADLSRTALYRALSEEGRPELSTIFKVMQALGLRLAPVRVDSAA